MTTVTTVKTLKAFQEVYSNIRITKEVHVNGKTSYSVLADSAQFGKEALMFEADEYDACLQYAQELVAGVYNVYKLNHARYHEDTLDTVYKWLGVKSSDDSYADENGRQTFIRVTNHDSFQALKEGYEAYHDTTIDYISIEVVTDSHSDNYMQILVYDTDGYGYDSEPIYFLEWKPKKSVYNKLTKIKYTDLHQ